MKGISVKNKVVPLTGPGVEYPALGGKVIRQARFENNEDYTALTIEFVDDTLVSFRFKASVAFFNCTRTFNPQRREYCELEGIETSLGDV
jgi:hypothetical protein